MSKAQYLLLLTFIGFYGLLLTFLLVRACAGFVSARLKPAIVEVPRRKQVRAHRAWTASVWRKA